jgi:vitamin B12 transporter
MKKTLMFAVFMAIAGMQGAQAQQTTTRLDEVVVTATKTEKEIKDVTQSVSVVTGEEIRKSGATSVAEAIQNVVGVTINDQGPKGALQTISIRGASYAQVLVLLDGMRMNSSRDGGVDLSALPVALEDIERIEIVRGPSSALYGADAVGGVMNIITKRSSQTVSKIGGAIGSHGYDDILVSTSGKDSGIRYSISGDRQTSDGYRPNSDLRQYIVDGRAGYDLSAASSLDVTANYISKENGVPGAIQFPSPQARQLERDAIYGITYRQKIGKEWDLKLSGYQDQNTLGYQDPDFFVNSRHETTTRNGEAQATWLMNTWNLFTFGYESRRNDLDSTDDGTHAATNDAGYVQDEISIGDSLIVVVGDRYDKHSIYGDKASPRVSGRYLIQGTGTIFRASAGKSFRPPTFNDLYWPSSFFTDSGTTFITQGNPNLVPESAQEYEGSIEQSLGRGNMLKATGFRRKVDNLIYWTSTQTEATTVVTMPQNIGKADIKGWEAEVVFRFADAVVFGANYTYMNPVDETTGQKIYYTIPKSQAKGHVTLSLDADTYLYVEGRAVDNYVPSGQPDWHYSVVDAKVAEKIGKKTGVKGEVFFAMSNIFDRQYDSVRSLSGGYRFDYPAPPREIRGGVTLSF